MRILLFQFFLLASFGTYAHSDIIMSANKGNIHLKYKTGWSEYEIGQRAKILLNLSEKLVKEKGYTKEHIYIYFIHDYTKRDTSYFALGYGQFSYWDYNNKNLTKDTTVHGLKLVIRDNDFNIKEVLNLINSALPNLNFIQINQKPLLINLHTYQNGIALFDTLSSIPSIQIKKYLSSSDTTIERLIKEKTYKNLNKSEESRMINYYYQNNKFYFYNTRESNKEWSEEQRKYITTKSYGNDILVVDNVFEIFESLNVGYFVFINDSIFYYIPQFKGKVLGPFKVDNIRVGRSPIDKYDHEYSPLNKFTLFFDNFGNENKVLFFPDSNVVISDFDKLENDFINGFFNKHAVKQPDTDSNLKLYLIGTVLILSIILNVWLWRNKK